MNELTEQLRELIPVCSYCTAPENDCAFPDCVGRFQTIDTELLVEVIAALPQWRDVREELPEEYQCCLAYSKKLDLYCAAMKLSDMNFECLEGGELLDWIPTHWMPLPAAPGGEG